METKKSNKVLTVLAAMGIMILFILTQMILIWVAGIVKVVADPSYVDPYLLQEYLLGITPLMQFVAEIVCIVVFGLWYYFGFVRKDKKLGSYESGFKKIANVKDLGFIVCLALGMYFFSGLFAEFVAWAIPGSEELLATLLGSITEGNEVLGFFSIALLAPLAEELAFRGVIMKVSKKAFAVIGCAVISALLFGLMHMNPLQSLYAIPLGAVLAFVAYKYNSVVPVVLMHLINNTVSWTASKLISNGVSDFVWAALCVVFLGLAFFIGRNLKIFEKKEVNSEKTA